MKLHRLKQTSYLTIQHWLEDELELTDYQKDKLRRKEILRFTKYKFFEPRQKRKVSFLCRLSIAPFFIFYLILVIGLPINFLFVGKWGYGDKLFNILSKWQNCIGL